MLFNITKLRDRGRRLKPDEWPAPVFGELVLEEIAAGANNSKRHMRIAKVMQTAPGQQWSRQLLPPLSDPELIRIYADGMLLRGSEIESVGGVVYDHVQQWLCRLPAAAPESVVQGNVATPG